VPLHVDHAKGKLKQRLFDKRIARPYDFKNIASAENRFRSKMSYLLQDFFYVKRSSRTSKTARYDVKLHESELYFLREDGKNGFVAQLKNITGFINFMKNLD